MRMHRAKRPRIQDQIMATHTAVLLTIIKVIQIRLTIIIQQTIIIMITTNGAPMEGIIIINLHHMEVSDTLIRHA